jgi:ASC-1-like (ASCH) protein
MLQQPVQSGITPTLSLQYSSASLGSSNLAKPQDSQTVLRRTESCAVLIGQKGTNADTTSRNTSEGQSVTPRNLTVNPSLQFKPVLGEGREERRGIVRRFFNEVLSKIYGSRESALSKIENIHSDRTCRLLYDGQTAVGVLVYKKNLTNEVLPNSMQIKTLSLIDSTYSGKGYGSVLLNRVEEVAAQLQAQSIHVTVSSTCLSSIEFFKKKGFIENGVLTILEKDESNKVFLIKKLATTQFSTDTPPVKKSRPESESSTKRKSLATPHDDHHSRDAKTSTKRPHSSKEQGVDESTGAHSSVQKSPSTVNEKKSFKFLMSTDSPASMQQLSRQNSFSNRETDSTARPSPNYNQRDARALFDRRDSASQRTLYVARRTLPSDASRAPKPMEATLKKIYVDMIKRGTKTIEGRINSGMFSNLREGQLARFFYSGRDSGEVTCEITKVNKYRSFEEMLTTEGYQPCLPDARSLQDAITTYDRIPTFTERARRSGVVAIHLKKISEK